MTIPSKSKLHIKNCFLIPILTHNRRSGLSRLFMGSGLSILFLAVATDVRGDTIATQGFNTTASSPAWTYTNTGGAASTTTGSSDTPANQRILEGNGSFQLNNGSAVVSFGSIDVSLYNDIYITLRLSSTGSSTNGADAGDYVHAFTSIDGAAFAVNNASGSTADISLAGNTNARYGYNGTLTATTTAGTNLTVAAPQGGTSTNNYSTFRINISDTASTVALRLNLLNNDGNEIWSIDSVSLFGTLAATSTSQFFDTNGTASGIGIQGGSPVLDIGTTNFSPTVAGTGPVASFNSNLLAVFGASGTGTSGTVTVSSGIVANAGFQFTSTGYVLTGGSLNLGGAAAANILTTDPSVTATINSAITSANGFTKAGSGTLILGGTVNAASTVSGGTLIITGDTTGNSTISAGTLQIGNGGSTGTLSGDVIDNSNLAFNRSDTYTFAGAISGTGAVQQIGGGTTILTGTNSYVGTTISAGTLQIGNGGIIGTLGSGAVVNNSILAFNRSDTVTVGNAISGTGTLRQIGSGTTVLTGGNSYVATEISAGTLQIGEGGTTGTLGSGAVTNNSNLSFNRSDSVTVGNSITGTGTVIQSGAGKTILTGANSYGATTISAGTLQIGNGGTTGTLGGGTVTNNTVLAINRSDAVMIGNTINGIGSVQQNGAGSTTLGGANGYSGGTTVNAGSLIAATNTALGTDTVTVNSGSLLANAGITVSNAITINGTPSQVLVSGYDFQTTITGGTAAAAAPGSPLVYNANFGSGTLYLDGTNGSSTFTSGSSNPQVTAFAGTGTVNTGPGFSTVTTNGALALANSSANGNAAVFRLNLSGLSPTTLSYATQGTASGFTTQTFAYSTDGATFTDFGTISPIPTSFALQSLTLPTALNNASTAYIRLTVTGATSATGNNRFDNIQFNAAGPLVSTAVLGSNASSGTATFGGSVTLNAGVSLTSAAGGTALFNSVFQNGTNGAQGITKVDTGLVVLTGNNTFTGATTVSAGTLEARGSGANQALGATSSVKANTGGTLLLGASNQINDTAAVNLAGGKLDLGGQSEGNATANGVGALTLTASSTLDFGTAGQDSSIIRFASISGVQSLSDNIVLSISDYQTTGEDHLYFAGTSTDFTSRYAQSEVSFNGIGGYGITSFSGYFEVTAVPEPSTWVGAGLITGLAAWSQRKRFGKPLAA